MSPNLVALLYLVAGVLFILALRGLSSPEFEPARQPVRHDRHGASPSPPRSARIRPPAGWPGRW